MTLMTDTAVPSRSCPCGMSAPQSAVRAGTERFCRCTECGLLTRPDGLSEEEVHRGYRDQYWAQFRTEQIGDARHNIHQHVMDTVEKWRPQAGRLVDVGCGAGHLLALAVERGWRAIGFELSAEAVATVRAKGLEVHQQGWPPCGLPDASVDAVTLVNVLDHLTAPLLALREASRVLKPGGLLYVRLPNATIHCILKQMASAWPFRAMGFGELPVVHLFGFGPTALRHHLRRCAFEGVSVHAAPPSGAFAYTLANRNMTQLIRWLKVMDRMLYRSLAACGLGRRGWALSIEAIARKPA